MRYNGIVVLILIILFFCNPIWAKDYKLTGRVIEQDLNCAGKPAQGIDKVNVTSECESGGPSGKTNDKGEYELNYQCESCINMVIYYKKAGYMPETRRIRSDMTDGSLGDITLRKVEKLSDYRYDDIITLFLVLLETRVWLDWRPTKNLFEVRSIWQGKLLEIEKDRGPTFIKAIEDYPVLFKKVINSLA